MKIFRLILVLCFHLVVYGQELPPIEKFTTSDYGGDNQNWMISQSDNNFIYVANNKGLLEYNGSVWKTYLSPNNSVLRAVKVVEDRIYTGCYAEFGFWKKNELGELRYSSLVPKLSETTFEDDQIWNILDYEEWVLFQSGHALFFYNKTTEVFKVVTSENIIYKVFKVGNQIYYHVANEGIYKIENGAPLLLMTDQVTINDRIINIFEESDKLILITRNSGFYTYENDILKKWDIEADSDLQRLNIFNGIRLENGNFVIGTILNGVIQINDTGKVQYMINQKNGLANNTVLSLFEDHDSNVWVGLDNGINCINLDSPIQNFIDYYGVLGTVYTTKVFKDYLYVGTNQGLFYKPLHTSNVEFQIVKGTAGQVWSLFSDNDDTLFCGHHLGTFIIDGDRSKRISSVLGAWNFKKFPNNENLLLQGNYDGLHVLRKTNNSWSEAYKIKGFNNSSRFFEINDANQIWVNNEYKGVFRLQLDTLLRQAESVKQHAELSKGKTSSLISYEDDILYASDEGIYKYMPQSQRFEIDTLLNALFSAKDYTSGRMIADKTGKLWMFSKNNISYIENDDLTNLPESVHISIPEHLRQGVLGFENIQLLNRDTYILGTSNGYLVMDFSKERKPHDHKIYLNEVSIADIDGNSKKLPIAQAGEFEHKQAILSFNYSVPEYDKFQDVTYSYRLNGLIDRWSSWSKKPNVQFENLSFGDYDFSVRAKVGNELVKNVETYTFKINRPWYISNLALVLYLLALIGIGFLVHKAYKFYYRRILKHEQIQNEKAIIQIQNEKLNQEIDGKNRELAISTMSIIKKNELLGKIKKELKKSSKKEEVTSAINLIDSNLNNNKDWKFFKEAFNNADKDFLDKIKAQHPDLTPNDLRFCAYLRLNLSSKEMAPLLNISIKSVETKRYRLRKRLGLQHDESLVNYILKF